MVLRVFAVFLGAVGDARADRPTACDVAPCKLRSAHKKIVAALLNANDARVRSREVKSQEV